MDQLRKQHDEQKKAQESQFKELRDFIRDSLEDELDNIDQ